MEALLTRLRALYREPRPVRILDVGGWYAPCRQATDMIDIMPFRTMNLAAAYGEGELRIREERYLQADLCSLPRFPYDDKTFDYVICRHTLEDIRDPIQVCRELNRVGRAGYIETPSRLCESTMGMERPWWCGHYHHRWMVEVEGNRIVFQFKPHNLHSSRKFHFRRWPWQKLRPELQYTHLAWEGSFEFEERIIIDYGEVKRSLAEFKRRHAGRRLFRMRWRNEER